jgi:hypothetical protein
MRNDAVSFNIAQEEAANQHMLLNILRSKERKPMHYAALTQVRSNLRIGWGATASGQFPNDDSAQIFNVSPNYSWGTNPTFDLAILDSEKFMRGIMKPVSEETFKYYLDQGWLPDMLLHLLVKRVDNWVWEDGKKESLDNYPTDKDKHERFKLWVKTVKDKLTITAVSTWDMLGPPLTAEQAADLEALVEARKADIVIVNSKRAEELLQVTPVEANRYFALKRITSIEVRIDKKLMGVPNSAADDAGVSATKRPSSESTMIMRSPESILYYLGQLARAEADGREAAQVAGPGDSEWPLFVVRKARNDEKAQISVEYDGTTYIIPAASDAGRSMQAISLVSQLIALHKSAEELPSTRAVTLIGQ